MTELTSNPVTNWRDYYEMCKPRVVMLMILTSLVGMFLAVPLTMLLKVTLSDSDEFKWFAVFLGSSDLEKDSQSDEADVTS